MKQVDITELTRRIEAIGRASPLAPRLKHVKVEAADDGAGNEYLRVILGMDKPDTLTWEIVGPLVNAIQDDVLEIDDRFPTVYFPDAA
jgi:hypothetical protein